MTKVMESLNRLFSMQKALIAILLILFFMFFINTPFYTTFNIINIFYHNSIYLILAMGQTIVLIAGGVDLSIGGVMTVAGILAIRLININVPIPIAVAISLLFGAVIGAINAYLSVHQKTEPFVITLGMGILLTGVAQELTTARPIFCTNPNFVYLSNFRVFGIIPSLIFVMIVVIIITYWILQFTSFGRNLYAIGGNYEVARYSGISVIKNKSLAYILCGITAALGGVMLSSKFNSGHSIYGDIAALLVVCFAVVGGTSVAGGIGGAIRSGIGILLYGVISNAFNMIGIDSYVQQALQGAIIVGIIWLDSHSRKRKREEV